MVSKNNIERVYKLTPMQQGMLFSYINEQNKSSYFIQKSLIIEGNLNIEMVKKSLEVLANKHSVLRTSIFYGTKGEPKQVVLKNRDIECNEYNCKDEEIGKIEQEDKNRGFDLVKDSLLRVSILTISDKKHVMIWSFHHIILDGWCMAILLGDFFAFYQSLVAGESVEQLKLQNRAVFDYSQYLNWLESRDLNAAKNYWKNLLADYSEDSEIKARIKLSTDNQGSGEAIYKLPENICEQIEETSKKLGVTFSNVVEFCWGLFFAKQNYLNQIVYGKVVSGRNAELKNIDQAMGLFINTIPVKIDLDNETFCDEAIKQLQEQALDSGSFDFYPLYEVSKLSDCGAKLIQNLYIFENYYIDKSRLQSMEGLNVTLDNKQEETEYELSLAVMKQNGYEFHFNYDATKYSVLEVEQFISHFMEILKDVVSNPHKKVKDINLINDEEKEEINALSIGEKKELEFTSISRRLEEMIHINGNRKAVVCGADEVTYEEFGNLVDGVVKQILDLGISAQERILVLCDKNIQMMVGIFAAIKCNCVYIPVQRGIPEERIDYIIKDSGAKVIISDQDEKKYPCIRVDLENKNVKTDISYVEGIEKSKLYILYTSGTTGMPKGVVVREDSVISLVNYLEKKIYHGYEHTNVALVASPMFDASVQQIFTSLMYGHTLHIITDDTKQNTESMWNYLEDNRITITDGTPSYFELLFNSNEGVVCTKEYLIGGEVLKPSLIKAISEKTNEMNIYNVYGPTETTVDVTCYHCRPEDASADIVPIGMPITNTNIYIMNGNSLCGKGMIGELCISGICVADGYFNNDEQTKMRFIGSGDACYFKSGDLGYWNENGQIEVIGRSDSQIKINGYRIEIEEIENQILNYSEIKETKVIFVHNKLYGFVVADNEVSCTSCIDYLSRKLPYYMIPCQIIQMEQLPRTVSGKVDGKELAQLAELAVTKIDEQEETDEPVTEEEKLLVEIYQKILGVDKVKVTDNFYSLGGDSIQAIRIISMVNDYDLKIKDILNYPQIRQLAKYMKTIRSNISQDEIHGEVKLLPTHQMFLNSSDENSYKHFNQSILVRSEKEVDAGALEVAVNELLKVHDGLRLRYHYGDKNGYILSSEEVKSCVETISCTESELKDNASTVQKKVNPAEGKNIVVAIINTEKNNYILVVLHHFASDAVSMRIVFDDLFTLYEQSLNHQELKVAKKTYSVMDWGEKQLELIENKKLADEISFWKEQESALEENKYDLCSVGDTKINEFYIDKQITSKVKTNLEALNGYNMQDVLLTCFACAQMDVLKKKELTVFVEGHGRDNALIDLNIAHTVGWFTSTYPIKISFQKDASLMKRIKHMHMLIDGIPNSGVGYAMLKTMTSQLKGGNNADSAMFNYLGEFTEVNNGALGLHWEASSIGKEVDDAIKMQNGMLVNVAIKDGQLFCNVRYDLQIFSDKKIKSLVRSFEKYVNKFSKLGKKNMMELSSLEYLHTDGKNFVTVINENGTKDLFLFPPAMLKVAYLPVYENLFAPYPELRLHVFHLTDDHGMAEIYADYIADKIGEIPLLFVGYSGGANIAYDTAYCLQNTHNINVDSIVMLDGFKWQTGMDFVTLDEENIEQLFKDFVEASNIDMEMLNLPKVQKTLNRERASFLNEAETYQKYCEKHKDIFDVVSDTKIYNLLSEDVFEDKNKDTRHGWDRCFDKEVVYMDLKGSHLSMLSNQISLKYNREIIMKVIKKGLKGKKTREKVVIECKDLKKSFGVNEAKVNALSGVDLKVYQGEFLVILGHSGSGKSTLLNVLSTLETPDQGEVKYYGQPVEYKNKKQIQKIRKEHIGFIFQQYHLIPNLTVKDNIDVGSYLAGEKSSVEEIFEMIGIDDKLNKYPYQLSGGEQQRVSIARALAKNTDILFCDEPTGALDTNTGIKVLKLLQKVQKERGVTVVIVTHNNLISKISDRVIHMKDGKITEIEKNDNKLAVEDVEWV